MSKLLQGCCFFFLLLILLCGPCCLLPVCLIGVDTLTLLRWICGYIFKALDATLRFCWRYWMPVKPGHTVLGPQSDYCLLSMLACTVPAETPAVVLWVCGDNFTSSSFFPERSWSTKIIECLTWKSTAKKVCAFFVSWGRVPGFSRTCMFFSAVCRWIQQTRTRIWRPET